MNNAPKCRCGRSPTGNCMGWHALSEEEYLEAKEALAMLSNNFNQGTTSINTLNLASENFNVGLEKANHITEFSQTTNKLLKN